MPAEAAQGMLAWPHSGFHVHDGVWVPAEDRPFALEFLAQVVSHIPNKGQVLQRYYGRYANRTRGIRRRAGVPDQAPAVAAEAVSRPPSYWLAVFISGSSRRRLNPRTSGRA